jgi:hypothetical protein
MVFDMLGSFRTKMEGTGPEPIEQRRGVVNRFFMRRQAAASRSVTSSRTRRRAAEQWETYGIPAMKLGFTVKVFRAGCREDPARAPPLRRRR